MRRTLLQQTTTLIIGTILLILAATACSQLADMDRDRLNEVAEQGQAIAQTVAADAPSFAATARSAAATAIVAAPTVAIDAQTAAATAVVNAQLLATQASASGGSLLILADRLQTRVAGLVPDEQGNIALTITEAELTGAITRDEIQEDASFENLAASFGDGVILITGDVTRPVSTNFAVVFIPYAQDGQLRFAIREASIGDIRLPEPVIARVEGRLNRTLQSTIEVLPVSVDVAEVIVRDDLMTISAKARSGE